MFRATSSRKSSYDDHPRSRGYKTETSDQEGFLELTSWQHQLCYLREVRHEEKHLNSYSLSFPNCDCPPFTETGHGSRSRLYRRQNLQVNTRWKALAEIYTMHSFAPFCTVLESNPKNEENHRGCTVLESTGEKWGKRAWPKQPLSLISIFR